MTIAMCNMTALLGGHKLNIPALVAHFSASWNPCKFATATVRMRNPRCCILLFSTGKVVCTGAKSEASALKAFAKFMRCAPPALPARAPGEPSAEAAARRAVEKCCVHAALLNIRIELMTARCSMGFPLDVAKMYEENKLVTILDELFPGLRWRWDEIRGENESDVTKITLLVFCNGNIVILGSKSRYQLLKIHTEIVRVMPKYKCSNEDMIRYQEARKAKKAPKRGRTGRRPKRPAVEAGAQASGI